MRFIWVGALFFIVSSLPGRAADLSVTLNSHKGVTITDAVVTFHPANAPSPAAPSSQTINQKNLQFTPFISVVPKGSSVDFINEDRVLHHVFSFSAAKRFSLKLFGKDEPQKVTFDQPGAVVVGCNIHDNMVAYLKIVETPFAAKTNAQGMASLSGLPDGPGELRVWHPLLKGKNNELRVAIAETASAEPLVLTAKFRRGARPVGDY